MAKRTFPTHVVHRQMANALRQYVNLRLEAVASRVVAESHRRYFHEHPAPLNDHDLAVWAAITKSCDQLERSRCPYDQRRWIALRASIEAGGS